MQVAGEDTNKHLMEGMWASTTTTKASLCLSLINQRQRLGTLKGHRWGDTESR